MRLFITFIAVVATGLLAGCASQPEGEAATSADERIICRSDRELGSTMTRRVCKTAREWEMERDAHQEGMRSIDRAPSSVASPGGNDSGS